MRLIRSLFLSAALLVPAAAAAAPDQSAPPSEIRLSDAEKEKVLEDAAASKRGGPVPIAQEDAPQTPQVHGEVGVTIGTGGYRSIYGTAFGPLGDQGVAAISLETTDFGDRHPYMDPWLR
jgi:hypothetical protein